MEKFFGTFSLQNLLRQFFCGVVFFVPFYLLDSGRLEKWLSSGGLDWSVSKVAALGVLACIIGTIIYHLEKNIYSYLMQAVFLASQQSKKKPFFEAIFYVFCFIVAFCAWFYLPVTYFLLFLAAFLIAFLVGNYSELHQSIRCQWIAEHDFSKQWKDLSRESHARLETCVHGATDKIPFVAFSLISERIARWSDFIHCVQSCCFAIIAGTFLYKTIYDSDFHPVYLNHQLSVVEHKEQTLGLVVDNKCELEIYCAKKQNKNCTNRSIENQLIVFSALVLVLEAFFDWHRYQHVLAITENINK